MTRMILSLLVLCWRILLNGKQMSSKDIWTHIELEGDKEIQLQVTR